MKPNKIPLSVLAPCDRTQEIWHQLNELRGFCSAGSRIDCDLREILCRLERLRDDIAMHFAYEWGDAGALREAALNRSVPEGKLSLFLQEQTQIYGMISELATDIGQLVHTYDVSPDAVRAAMSRFKAFDALLISHESRKSMAVHAR